MPSCASEISPPDRSDPGGTRSQALTGTSASGPAAAPPPSPQEAGGQSAGEAAPTQGCATPAAAAAGRARLPRQAPARSPAGPPIPHSPCPRRRGGLSRRRRHRPARCSSAAGVTAANGAASAGAGGPRSGAEPPPPAQPPRREGGGCQVPADRGRRLPGVGLGRDRVSFSFPAVLGERPEGKAAGRSPRLLPLLGLPSPLRSKPQALLLSPSLLGTAGVPRGASRKY